MLDTAALAEVRQASLEIVARQMGEPRVAELFASCFDRSIPETLRSADDGSVFVVTGDIPAMWLRDSACQVRPLLPFASEVAGVEQLVSAVLRRQMRLICLDPYANAFNPVPNGAGHADDRPRSSPWVWERKYEVDSLAHPFHLGYLLYLATGRASWFDSAAQAAARLMVATLRAEQFHETRS
ncbi:MAG: glycoside hydrolase family 125 protein, partial [Propionibacteriaceae bacterium]|nr:glycoside hydrolase family 125 protein [Propionibacteriaceae bacterium]